MHAGEFENGPDTGLSPVPSFHGYACCGVGCWMPFEHQRNASLDSYPNADAHTHSVSLSGSHTQPFSHASAFPHTFPYAYADPDIDADPATHSHAHTGAVSCQPLYLRNAGV